MELHGKGIIAGQVEAGKGETTFHGINPATGHELAPGYRTASPAQVRQACAAAASAAEPYRHIKLSDRAALLDAIADNIEALGEPLIHRAMEETGLPQARLEGERARTTGQLRLFANVVRQGDFLDRKREPSASTRAPSPQPELRSINIPLGPVAVFGASNFPLAFSVAGGDTAAGLAAGCPVVFKAHPAHPGTCELVAGATLKAITQLGLPPSVFSLLFDAGHDVGAALVADPDIQAVAFTGSRRGGLALADIAAQRPVPIPVYAEMGSINPVFLLPGALAKDSETVAKDWTASLQLGAGQFCTNPGLLVVMEGAELTAFLAQVSEEISPAQPQTMLTPAIAEAYKQGVAALTAQADTALVARGATNAEADNASQVHVFRTSAAAFTANPELSREVFGACSLIVTCPDFEAMQQVAHALEGQLTATLLVDESGDAEQARQLLDVLDQKAGRIIFNGYPTGVAVSPAMVHGGPYPATTDARSTSVGTAAIARFLRPICYQDCPAGIYTARFGS